MPKPHGALGYRPPAPETVPHHRPVPAFAHEGLDANLTLRVPGTTRVGAIAVSRTRFPWTQNWLNQSVQGGPEHDR